MKERFKNLKNGVDEIRSFYDKIDDTTTQVLNEIMPYLGESFPRGEPERFNTVNRNLGNKLFEDMTRLERIYRENGRYNVKVKFFTMAWGELPFFDKFEVLGWINDIIDAWEPKDEEILKAMETLETGISEIKRIFIQNLRHI